MALIDDFYFKFYATSRFSYAYSTPRPITYRARTIYRPNAGPGYVMQTAHNTCRQSCRYVWLCESSKFVGLQTGKIDEVNSETERDRHHDLQAYVAVRLEPTWITAFVELQAYRVSSLYYLLLLIFTKHHVILANFHYRDKVSPSSLPYPPTP